LYVGEKMLKPNSFSPFCDSSIFTLQQTARKIAQKKEAAPHKQLLSQNNFVRNSLVFIITALTVC
jgi:hypothetical protein